MAKTALKKTETKALKAEKKPKVKKVKAAGADKTAAPRKACKMASCKRRYKAKGYCVSHYREWRHGKFGKVRYKQCSDQNCAKPMVRNHYGYCEDHFQSIYIKGEVVKKAAPEAPAKTETKTAEAS